MAGSIPEHHHPPLGVFGGNRRHGSLFVQETKGERQTSRLEGDAEEKAFWKDHKGAKINAIRTRTALEMADVVVVKFGEKYRQWNAAFDAGFAAALGTPIIVIHPPEFTHALKEIDGAAQAVAENSAQVVEILKYAAVKE